MKKILALETTEKWGSVAMGEGEHLIAEMMLPRDRRSAQTLALSMDALLRQAKIVPSQIEAVGVVIGPGSFTGLRVGVATAKMFAYAVGAEVVALNTFETISDAYARSTNPKRHLIVGVDAQRGEVVVQQFVLVAPKSMQSLDMPKLVSIADCWNLAAGQSDVCFAGPFLERWGDRIPQGISVCDDSFRYPQAKTILQLTAKRLAEGKTIDLDMLLPIYSRLSAAEEKRLSPPVSP